MRWNLESNSAARLDRRLDKKRERESKGGKTPKSEKPNPIPVCSETCMEFLQKSLEQLQLEDLIDPEDYDMAAEMLTEAVKSIGEVDLLVYAEGLEDEKKKKNPEEIEIQSACK